jgi:hypothetical protein
MRWFDKLLGIDRRWIFLAIGIAVVIPFFAPMGFPVVVTEPVQRLYDAVEGLPTDGKPLFLSMDYAPATTPELDPMSIAIMRHAFRRGLPVVVLTLHPAGYGLAQRAIATVVDEREPGHELEYGTDYIFLGFHPGIAAVMLGMGIDVQNVWAEDAYGTPTADLPIMEGVRNYDDIPLVISIAGSAYPDSWIYYAYQPYGQRVAAGVTAVMATDYYPYLDSGQMVGLLGGMRGAAEYEELIQRHDKGVRGMDSQSVIHIFIIVLVILGNVAYFAQRKGKRAAVEPA